MTPARGQAASLLGRTGHQVVVGVGEFKVSQDPKATLVTYSLGSCIAVAVYDPIRRAGGLIHYMLPSSKCSSATDRQAPSMFCDTGIPLLFKAMYELGCLKRSLVVKVAGGGQFHGDDCMFKIGRRNYTVLRKVFERNDVVIDAEDVGGDRSRTVRLDLATGRFAVTWDNKELEL